MKPTELEQRLGERLSRALALSNSIREGGQTAKDKAHLEELLHEQLQAALHDLEATHA